jgi:hypothetical protein
MAKASHMVVLIPRRCISARAMGLNSMATPLILRCVVMQSKYFVIIMAIETT